MMAAPGIAGFNDFTAYVSDYNTGAPVDASSVQLQFSNPLRSTVAQSNLTLARQSTGVLSARGANLSLNGVWQITAIINNGLHSTEVSNLLLFTDEPQPQVTITKFSGEPTLYTAQLSKGRTAQVYLDSATREFHVTYFAAGGTGEVQTSSVIIGETPLPAGLPTVLSARRLDPSGHWVADAMVPAGEVRFDIIATLPTGEVLATHVTITPGS